MTKAQRVLVVCQDRLGANMAGPAIRSCWLARVLRDAGYGVDLFSSQPAGDDFAIDGVQVESQMPGQAAVRRLGELAARASVAISLPVSLDQARALHKSNVQRIVDAYVPTYVEEASGQAARIGDAATLTMRKMAYRKLVLRTNAALLGASAVLCASAAQRQFWLGALGSLGAIDIAEYTSDPELGKRIAIAPFGVEPDPPQARAEHSLRATLPGVGKNDLLLLWAGGIWDWLDPLTVLEAVGKLAGSRPDLRVRLCFMGMGHPSPYFGKAPMDERLRARARELDITDKHVFFLDRWTPYDVRGSYLLDADIGVCAHEASVETELSYRTRLLDHFWAGLPTITTEGGVLSDKVALGDAGVTVGAGDVNAWAAAIEQLGDDKKMRKRQAANARALAVAMTWPQVLAPVVEIVGDLVRRPHRRKVRRGALASISARYAYLAARVGHREHGVRGMPKRPRELFK